MKGFIHGFLVLALVSGCADYIGWRRPDTTGAQDEPVSFWETMRSQEAVFYLPLGWCGAIGTPICDAQNQPLRLDGQPVFFTGDISEIAKRSTQSRNGPGGPHCLVHARVHVEKCRGTNRSLPPQYWHEEDYFGLVIEEILDVQAKSGQ